MSSVRDVSEMGKDPEGAPRDPHRSLTHCRGGQLCSHLGYVADVHFHVAALTGPIQPLHVHIQRPGDE